MKQWLPVLFFALTLPLLSIAAEPNGDEAVVPVQIKRLLLINNAPAVLLVDKPEERFLLVFIDFFMANAIRMGMDNSPLERPLTHDLIGILMSRLGAQVTKITITHLKRNTYYALLTLVANGNSQEIDARPSDALAIAVRKNVPIFAAPHLLKPLSEEEASKRLEEKAAPLPIPPKKGKART